MKPFETFHFVVYAVNSVGRSGGSDVLKLVTGKAPPEVVTGLRVVHTSATHLAIDWRVPKDNGDFISHYLLFMNGTQVYNGAENRVRIKGLESSGLYSFKVAAVNGCGTGLFSEEAPHPRHAAPCTTGGESSSFFPVAAGRFPYGFQKLPALELRCQPRGALWVQRRQGRPQTHHTADVLFASPALPRYTCHRPQECCALTPKRSLIRPGPTASS